MYVLFGTKWCNIFSGPMWSYAPVNQTNDALHGLTKDPINALVNVPAPSDRTVRRSIASNDFSIGADIQTKVLDKLAKMYPDVRWWLKGDGTDVVKGLWKSTLGEWARDVDLNDGNLQQQYTKYKCRMEEVKGLGIGKSIEEIRSILSQEVAAIRIDLSFISNELQNINKNYEEKLRSGSTEKNMFILTWEIEELKSINNEGRTIHEDLLVCINFCTSSLFE
ncbi:uncharacterized protein [Dysidea avara]|uniref:uncharacterized protein n=1 Tax=Dysidea avara TaxID=196820 RepID=UPI00332B591A